MAGFSSRIGQGLVSIAAVLAIAAMPLSASAISILGIDVNGDIHSISTDDGSFTTLGSTGLSPPDSLERSPSGQLYAVSRESPAALFAIDESDFSIGSVANGNVLTGGAGGLVFVSDTLAYGTTRSILTASRLFEIDLSQGTITAIGLVGMNDDIFALAIRGDGMLVGVARQSGSLLEINPTTAETTVISNLAGISVADFGGFVQTSEGLFFANSTLNGSVNEIWTIDPYTGAHALQSTVIGLPGLKGLATIPEPGTALLLGIGLTLFAVRRSHSSVLVMLVALPAVVLPPSPAVAGEIEDILSKACEAGIIGEADCAEMLACLEDPTACPSGGGESLSGPSAFTAMAAGPGGGTAAMMAPIAGALIDFRVDNSENPRIAPGGIRMAFEELNGPRRIHRAVFLDGIPAGTKAPNPNPLSSHTDILGGIDDGNLIVATHSIAPDEAYLNDTSSALVLPLVDAFSNAFEAGRAFDVDDGSQYNSGQYRIAGSVYDLDVGAFGKTYPSLWERVGTTGAVFQLRRFNGLTASTTWVDGQFTKITPAGDFAVGFGGSGSVPAPFGHQAFKYTYAGSSFLGLPLLPSPTTAFSEAHGVSDSGFTIAGVATNSSGNNVATVWRTTNGTAYTASELDLLGSATTSRANVVAPLGDSIGGSVGAEAAVWNPQTLEAHRLQDIVIGIGLTVPPECTLSSVNDITTFSGVFDFVVGEATCDTGSGPFKRVFELQVPFAVPEPGFASGLLLGALGLPLASRRRLRVSTTTGESFI